MTQLLKVAKAYVAKGWRVFPLDGKIPHAGTHGFLEATVEVEQLVKWWTRWPTSNIGIRTGNTAEYGSGIWVLDLDSDTDAEERVELAAAGRP